MKLNKICVSENHVAQAGIDDSIELAIRKFLPEDWNFDTEDTKFWAAQLQPILRAWRNKYDAAYPNYSNVIQNIE